MKFNIINFIRAMQNDTKGYYIYRIEESVYISYDPECDTTLCGYYESVRDIPNELLEAEIQDFYIEPDFSSVSFYI